MWGEGEAGGGRWGEGGRGGWIPTSLEAKNPQAPTLSPSSFVPSSAVPIPKKPQIRSEQLAEHALGSLQLINPVSGLELRTPKPYKLSPKPEASNP